MKVLFVAMDNSRHTYRWVTQLSGLSWDVRVFSSHHIDGDPNLFSPEDCVPVYRVRLSPFAILLRALLKTARDPRRHLRNLLRLKIRSICDGHRLAAKKTEKTLASVIREMKPDILHTLHTQTSARLVSRIRPQFTEWFPVWIHSVWGSDLYFCGRFPEEKASLTTIMSMIDYFIPEGERDVKLAAEFGFRGTALPPVPAFGGIRVDELPAHGVPPSRRKAILVKGYQNAVGRFFVALRALERCRDQLDGYEIFVTSATSEEVDLLAQLFQIETGVKMTVVHGLTRTEVMQLFARARLYVGLSISDGLPSSFVEALTYGVYPVQSFTSLAHEWVQDGVTGSLVPPNDPEVVAAAIRVALTDDRLVDAAAEANRKTVETRLSYDRVRQQVQQNYWQAVAHGRVGSKAGA